MREQTKTCEQDHKLIQLKLSSILGTEDSREEYSSIGVNPIRHASKNFIWSYFENEDIY